MKKSPQYHTMDVAKIAKANGMSVEQYMKEVIGEVEDAPKKKDQLQFDPTKLKYGPRID